MTTLSHFLEEGEISDPDENLIRVRAGAAPSTAVSRTHPQRWSLARCEAEQTIPGSEALGWVEVAGPASPAALLSPTEQGQEELQQLPPQRGTFVFSKPFQETKMLHFINPMELSIRSKCKLT